MCVNTQFALVLVAENLRCPLIPTERSPATDILSVGSHLRRRHIRFELFSNEDTAVVKNVMLEVPKKSTQAFSTKSVPFMDLEQKKI